MKFRKLATLLLAAAVLSAGCNAGDTAGFIKGNYSLENVEGQGAAQQKVYRAAGQTVPAVAKEIAAEQQPQEMSKEDENSMFLVYSNHVVHVQKDPDNAEDALVELNTHEYVRQHYDPSFLNGFLAASVISSLFGSGWRSRPHGGYYGYGRYRYERRYGTAPGGGYRTPTAPRGGYTSPSPGFRAPRSGGGRGRVIRR